MSRLSDNWAPTVRRLRAAQASQARAQWGRWALVVVAGIALVIVTGALFDAGLIAWSASLPAGIHDFFGWVTRYGQSDWLLILAAIVVLAIALGDWRGVDRRAAAAWWEIGTFAAIFFVVIAVTGFVTDIIKPIVGRFRPDFVPEGAFAFAPFSFGGYAHYSFPSGHATTMGAVAVFAWFAPRVLTAPILVVAGTIAISRVIIGVHFPSDVVGGALIGVGFGYLMVQAFARAGLAFVVRPNGTIRPRFDVLRNLLRRDRTAPLLPALWAAWRGRA